MSGELFVNAVGESLVRVCGTQEIEIERLRAALDALVERVRVLTEALGGVAAAVHEYGDCGCGVCRESQQLAALALSGGKEAGE